MILVHIKKFGFLTHDYAYLVNWLSELNVV